jgi:NADPH-dependent 2,4-dienoyl-CoA reductase/sulfur reductase-like enzyme/nitrite reductase/ring-hydroxylating ferredoxin subunit
MPMSDASTPLTGPDFVVGIESSELPQSGTLLGHAQGEPVLLVRPAGSDEVFAVSPTCTHYGGPLAEGLLEGHCLHCPWHHARFDVRTGDAVAAPALTALGRWRVERRGPRIVVAGKAGPAAAAPPARSPSSVVIVGAGAAGNAAAEMLRREGYLGPVTLIGGEPTRPVDRPNLSKDYLAGTAPEDWVPLRGEDFYGEQDIELVLGTRVTSLDTNSRRVALADGTHREYEALLLATGADPVRLAVPGADAPHVFTLRSLADSRAIIARATAPGVARAVVIGASFIGLEAAAALRARGLKVCVVGPEARPLERVLGKELGDFVRTLHESHGVHFHLGRTATAIEADAVLLDDGSRARADLVVVGIGVRPALALAEQAGLKLDRGVLVNEFLETSARGVYAAGDIARYLDPRTGRSQRIEHWVVAERQGQTAARNMLGRRERFGAVPFFWSQHYDVAISYVGHAEGWDDLRVSGRVADGNCLVSYVSKGRIDAVATIGRDLDSLRAEVLFERDDQAGLAALAAGVEAIGRPA